MFNLSYFKDGMIGDNQFIVKDIGYLYLGSDGHLDEWYDYWIVDENGNRMEEVGVLKYNDKSIILADGSTFTFRKGDCEYFLDNIGLYYIDFKTQSEIWFLKYPQTLLHKIVFMAVSRLCDENDKPGQPYILHVIREMKNGKNEWEKANIVLYHIFTKKGNDREYIKEGIPEELLTCHENVQTLYQRAILFAAERHGEQKIPGSNIPYIVHISNVCMEIILAAPHIANFNLPLAVQIALLHDVLEDTDTTEYELLRNFGAEVAAGVKALTKDKNLPKEHQMSYSLTKISRQSGETKAVKLADRITNLQPPPSHWTKEKMMQYHQESIEIYNRLNWKVNEYLRNRLKDKIDRYLDYM